MNKEADWGKEVTLSAYCPKCQKLTPIKEVIMQAENGKAIEDYCEICGQFIMGQFVPLKVEEVKK